MKKKSNPETPSIRSLKKTAQKVRRAENKLARALIRARKKDEGEVKRPTARELNREGSAGIIRPKLKARVVRTEQTALSKPIKAAWPVSFGTRKAFRSAMSVPPPE